MIGILEEDKPPTTPEETKELMILDMTTLCEALCTLIHVAHTSGYKEDYKSLKDCIKHLEDGFSDSSYKTENVLSGGTNGG